MRNDSELLRRFAVHAETAAFDELARRHLDLVYSAALRQCGGDAQMAKDVTQMVLIDLARKAASLQGRASIVGWLHTATRFAAAALRRSERSRKAREMAAADLLGAEVPGGVDADWRQLQAVLDDALGDLKEAEREVVLLRYLKGCSYAAIAQTLRLSETAARSRADRALDRLREKLARRGIHSTASALATAMVHGATTSIPVELAAAAIGGALAAGVGGATAAGGASGFAFGKLAAMALELFAMKTATALLVASVVVNAALGSLYFAKKESEPDYARFEEASTVAKIGPLARAATEAKQRSASAPAPVAAKLDLTDQATLIRKMEEDGFDRDSIGRAIRGLYAHHRLPLRNEQLSQLRSLQRRWNLRPRLPGPELRSEEIDKRVREREAEIEAVLIAAGYGSQTGSGIAKEALRQLAPAKAEALQRIEKDYAALSDPQSETAINWNVGGDREKARVLWTEFEKDVRALLSPAEATEYFRNNSPAAKQVQKALRSNTQFDLEPEKYAAIVDGVVAGQPLVTTFRKQLGDERFVTMLDGFDEMAATADAVYRAAGFSPQRRADLFVQAAGAIDEFKRLPRDKISPHAKRLYDLLVKEAQFSGPQLEAFHASRLGKSLLAASTNPLR